MKFQQTMIDELRAETAVRLKAIQAASGQIAEAEAIAEALNAAGLRCTLSGNAYSDGDVRVWVNVWPALPRGHIDADVVVHELRANDLVVSGIETAAAGDLIRVNLQGLRTHLAIYDLTAAQLYLALISYPTEIILVNRNLTLLETIQAAEATGMHLISNGRDTRVASLIPEGWYVVPAQTKAPTQASEAVAA